SVSLIVATVRYGRAHAYVPCRQRQAVNLLAFMCKAKQRRAAPALAAAQKPQAAVIKAATHAQPPAFFIESHQGHQDQIQGPGCTLAERLRTGLEDAEAVALQRFTRLQSLEIHTRARPGVQH